MKSCRRRFYFHSKKQCQKISDTVNYSYQNQKNERSVKWLNVWDFFEKSGSLTTLQTTTVAPFLAWRGSQRNDLDCRGHRNSREKFCKGTNSRICSEKKMAEMQRFELWNGFLRYTLSKRAPSTARTHLQLKKKNIFIMRRREETTTSAGMTPVFRGKTEREFLNIQNASLPR